MTASALVFVIYSGLMLFLSVVIARALITGRIGGRANSFGRYQHPPAFWFQTGHAFVLLVALGCFLYLLGRGVPPNPVNSVLVLLGLVPPTLFWLVRALQNGRVTFRSLVLTRRGDPVRYHLGLAAGIAALAGVAWFAVQIGFERRPDDWATVRPVVRAVRAELGTDRMLPFARVRLDTRSGLVCGTAGLGPEARRFFGKPHESSAIFRVEDGGSDFDRAFRKFCGTAGRVPGSSA